MPICKEPEIGAIINRGEYHIPVVVVLDVSWKDTEEYKRIVSHLATEFFDVAKEDSFASGRFDICLIASNNGGQILNPFCPPSFLTVLFMDNLNQNGECDMDAAVQNAVNQIEQRILLYKTNGVSSYNPSLYIFSSKSNPHFNNTTVDLMRQKKKPWNVFYYVIPLNNRNYYKLFDDIKLDYAVLPYSIENLRESFDQISLRHSVSSVRTEILGENDSYDEQIPPPAPNNLKSDFDYLKGEETTPYIRAIDKTLTAQNIPYHFNWTEEGVCKLEFDINCIESGISVLFKGKLVKILPNADKTISVDFINNLLLNRYKLLKIDYTPQFNALYYAIHAEYNMYVHGNPNDFSEYLLEMIKRFKDEWETLTQIFPDDKYFDYAELLPPPSNVVVGI